MSKSSTGDLVPGTEKQDLPSLSTLKQPISHQNNSVEVFTYYGHIRWIYANLQVQRRTEAIAREPSLL